MTLAEPQLRALKYQRMKLRYQLFHVEPKMKKKHPEYADDESDIDDEWIAKHEVALVDKLKEAARKKFDKDTAKAAADGDDPPDPSLLEEKIADADAELARLEGERGSKAIEGKRSTSADKLVAAITKMDERIAAQRTAAIDKDEGASALLTVLTSQARRPRSARPRSTTSTRASPPPGAPSSTCPSSACSRRHCARRYGKKLRSRADLNSSRSSDFVPARL